MPTRYNRSVLQTHADTLYDQADNIVLSSAVASAFSLAAAGGAIGFTTAYSLELDVAGCSLLGALVGGIIGFAWGWHLGQQQAFKLRLQAQELLCQMMIESNTAALLRLAGSESAASVVPLDEATLQSLRPGHSTMRARMGGLGQ